MQARMAGTNYDHFPSTEWTWLATRVMEAPRNASVAAELRARVTSKGGTTERGILALEEGGVAYAIGLAARAASERAAEMGVLLGRNGDQNGVNT